MKVLKLITCVAATFFAQTTAAFSDEPEHGHPPEHTQLHDDFYSKWKRPDDPKVSCCGGQDCFPVEIKHVAGNLYVKSRWNGQWVLMPPEKIDRRNVSPDGQNHACLSPPSFEAGQRYEGNAPLCFMYGQGT